MRHLSLRSPARAARVCGALVLVAVLACVPAAAYSPSELGFATRVSAALVAHYATRFGPLAPERMGRWIGYATEQKTSLAGARPKAVSDGDARVLQDVNDAINQRMSWVEDSKHWGAEDYWATPTESIGSAGGDCEDYAIAKYYLLKELGMPIERLRITYVRALGQQGQAHMVLAYFARPEAEPLILDNLDPRVRPAAQRADLEPVYSFNDDEVQLVQSGRRAKPPRSAARARRESARAHGAVAGIRRRAAADGERQRVDAEHR